jgi:hypothetical protein
MAKSKRPRKQPGPAPIDLPISDNAEISQTTIYPTIEAMWKEFSALPWFEKYSPGTRRTIRFVFFNAIAETLRTVAFRINADQDTRVFDDFGAELQAYDKELQRQMREYNVELH